MTSSVPPLAQHVQRLEAVYRDIAATSMRGLPVLHPGLSVLAIGFEPVPTEPGVALGVLVTPWFMNLLRLPLDEAATQAVLPVGVKAERDGGTHRFEFIGAQVPAFGAFEMASLFSPMAEFADQAAAVATAREVLALLRPVDAVAAPAPTAAAPVPSRRGFLFGRAAAGDRR
ncbi:[NiFe]-hydrogenase assembly chaperone HybE [Ideonella sp. A 288]|uniref:[NiFe]-hydrogenase assembly chaperone HybE n=1 Tax=Ideonella sp. A 288 TaxID=1962181 RepID=UPI000B4BB1CD|nr:[NiFe]-hydrogenase assembly chaperone HybE [Ideonella sp. A 288]